MAVKGIRRYMKLFKNIQNPSEYILNKSKRKKRLLNFTTRGNLICFTVSESTYALFKEIFMEDVYDTGRLLQCLPHNPVVIDIGANVGFFDILLLSKRSKAKIFAYEPIAANVNQLLTTANNNPTVKNAVKIFERAVCGTNKGSVELFAADTGDNQVVASTVEGFNKNNTKKIIVGCITLQQIIEENKLENISLLKVDCEGSEYDILYNTPSKIFDKIGVIAMEVHNLDTGRNNLRTMLDFLASLGYKMSYEPINEFCYSLLAVK